MPNRKCSRNDCRNDAFDSNVRYGNECQKCLCVTFAESNKGKSKLIQKGELLIEKRSISGVIGKGDLYHNNRRFVAENVDKSRIVDNITIISEDVKTVYHELFDDALAEYNSKQKRKDRIIKDYHDHIRHSRQEKEFHEVIFQIGNKDDTPCGSDISQRATEALKQYAESFQKRNPHLRMFNAVIHLDEATPHIHIDFVPFATEQKRGLSTRVSLSKALEQQGFTSEGKLNTCSKLWIDSEKQALADIMKTLNIEWEQKGTHNEHLSVLDYKKKERKKEVVALENKLSKLSDKETKIKAIDNIPTKKTMFGDNLTVSREDYESLAATAKKQIVSEKKEKKQKAEIFKLQQENAQLKSELTVEKKKNADSKSINLRIENAKLKEQVSKMETVLKKAEEFLKGKGLYELFQNFVLGMGVNRNRNKDGLE